MYTDSTARLLNSFAAASGVKLALYDRDFRQIYETETQGLAFCSVLHESRDAISACFASDKSALSEVRKSGEAYSFVCPFGIYEMLFPICARGVTVGYVFCAAGISDTRSKDTVKSAAEAFIRENETHDRLCSSLKSLPVLKKERIDAIRDMLSVLVKHIESTDAHSFNESTLAERARLYIKQSISKKLTLDDICLDLHCSRATLTAAFRREHGTSVLDFIITERMKRAEELLLTARMSMAEIAEACGFSGAEYFSASFKRLRGVSPTAWQRAHLK